MLTLTKNPLFEIVQGATMPRLAVTLVDEDGIPIDLTSATVRLAVAAETETNTAALIIDAAMTVDSDATSGIAVKSWSVGELDEVSPGPYYAMIEVTYFTGETPTGILKYGPIRFKVLESVRKG